MKWVNGVLRALIVLTALACIGYAIATIVVCNDTDRILEETRALEAHR